MPPTIADTEVVRASSDPTKEQIIGGGARGFYTGFSPTASITLAGAIDDVIRRYGIGVYDLMWRSTPKAPVMTLVTGVFRDGLDLSPSDSQDPEAAEVCDFARRMLLRTEKPFIDTVKQLLKGGLKTGAALAEKTFEVIPDGVDAGKLGYKSIKVKGRRSWDFVVDPYMSLLGVVAATRDGQAFVPLEKVVPFSWDTEDDDPRGNSILRDAYEPWHYQMQIGPQHQKHLQQFAEPSLYIELPPGDPKVKETDSSGNTVVVSAFARAEQAAERFRNGSYMIGGHGGDAKILESNTAGQAFVIADDMYSRKIASAILYAARATVEAKNSSKADSDGAKDVVDEIINYMRDELARVIEDHVLYPLILLNYGKEVADRVTPTVSFGSTSVQDRPALWGGFARLIQAKAITASQYAAMCPDLGLPVPTPGELAEWGKSPEPEPPPDEGDADPDPDQSTDEEVPG